MTTLRTELRYALRGIRARRWRAVLIVGLLAVSLGASAIVFSAADSFVFRRVPYPGANRLVVLQQTRSMMGASDYVAPEVIPEWRKHEDLFSAVHAHDMGASLYVTSGDVTEAVITAQVTPGLFETLGVAPRWGRTLQPGDEDPSHAPKAMIAEDLAHRLFPDPSTAVGQTITLGSETLHVVGVMPTLFRFPTSRERVWRPLDLARWPANTGVRGLFQLAPGVNNDAAARAVTDRGAAVARVITSPWRRQPVTVLPLATFAADSRADLIFAMLMAAAACVGLIACANVASLELANAIRRGRSFAIHSALGATRATLVRIGLIEGALMVGASVVLAWFIAHWGVSVLALSLPPTMTRPLANPIDLDARALACMTIAAVATWFLTCVPVARRATRADVVELLKRDDRTMGVSAGARLRQTLMVGQVALTVMLLIAAALTVRTYAANVGLEKGFDSSGLAAVEVVQPRRSSANPAELEQTLVDRLRSMPGVDGVARTDGMPPSTQGGIGNYLFVDGRERTTERIKLAGYAVDPDYFSTMGVRLLAGRVFAPGDPPGYVVVDERFAARYWPNGDALGARFNMGGSGWSGVSDFEIVGVAAPVRMESTETPGGDEVFVVYHPISPKYSPLSFVVRLEDERQLGALASLVRSLAPGAIVRVDLVEERYRRLYGDVRLAASVTGGFGALAFVVAMAGVYGVMAFLVTGRRREIGVRIAFGAQPTDIRRMFLAASARFVLVGAALGVAGAYATTRAVETKLQGVQAADPLTFAGVVIAVLVTALAATWLPARQAARVDPVISLRAE